MKIVIYSQIAGAVHGILYCKNCDGKTKCTRPCKLNVHIFLGPRCRPNGSPGAPEECPCKVQGAPGEAKNEFGKQLSEITEAFVSKFQRTREICLDM